MSSQRPSETIGPCINDVVAPPLWDSEANLWNPFSPRYHPKKQRPFLGDPMKRGANQLCASGAFVRRLLMQLSIKPGIYCCAYGSQG